MNGSISKIRDGEFIRERYRGKKGSTSNFEKKSSSPKIFNIITSPNIIKKTYINALR
tara:strand:- start:1173 stop:1343 length:171 start_codon:yes stop_codon:yes gene_type:complete